MRAHPSIASKKVWRPVSCGRASARPYAPCHFNDKWHTLQWVYHRKSHVTKRWCINMWQICLQICQQITSVSHQPYLLLCLLKAEDWTRIFPLLFLLKSRRIVSTASLCCSATEQMMACRLCFVMWARSSPGPHFWISTDCHLRMHPMTKKRVFSENCGRPLYFTLHPGSVGTKAMAECHDFRLENLDVVPIDDNLRSVLEERLVFVGECLLP